jgi:hypothetical protein
MMKLFRIALCVALAAPASAFFRKMGGNTPAHQKSWPKNRQPPAARMDVTFAS